MVNKMSRLGCLSIGKAFRDGDEEITFHMEYTDSKAKAEETITKVLKMLRPYGFIGAVTTDVGGVIKVRIR